MKSILVINGGSSTVKIALFEENNPQPISQTTVSWENDFETALKSQLTPYISKNISCIGHRVVHGGELFQKTVRIDENVKKQIENLFFLAPLHNPINLAGIQICEKLFPKATQYAVFDTAFHATLEPAAFTYPLPLSLRDESVRRYGFHGISYSYCSCEAAHFLKKDLSGLKMVICHLGAGASLCALKDGKSVDTTMGMTPLEGLMMATRSGTIDPGILLYLLREKKYSTEALEKMLNYESGLKGISGNSDMKDVEDRASQGDERAQLALDIYVHRLKRCLGEMVGVLAGLDVLVFTAGIGENSSFIREKCCAGFGFLGVELDAEKNRAREKDVREISSIGSRVKVLVIPTCEEWEIAREGLKLFD